MTTFDPKKLFQENQAIAEELQAHRQDNWMRIGFAFTLSKMAFDGASEQAIHGARVFISTFQNLWEKELTPSQLPKKELNADKPRELEADKK